MDPVRIDWSSARVESADDGFRLEVKFDAAAPHYWWNAFSAALESSTAEQSSSWRTIRGLGDPPEGLEVGGVREAATQQLRTFLDEKVAAANEEAERAEEGREALRRRDEERSERSTVIAERLTESFRSGS